MSEPEVIDTREATDEERNAALLHDVLEDTSITAGDLRRPGERSTRHGRRPRSS